MKQPSSTSGPADLADSVSLFAPLPSRGIGGRLLDLLASVRLGIVTMIALFVYSSVGSAGIVYPDLGPGSWNVLNPAIWRHEMIRQWPMFELTEFEWFHTPFFNGLIALLCVNMIVATLRRIRLSVLNLGVWMIHTGIIVLCVGSVVYFGTKFEGDAPVIRREVVIEIPGVPTARMAALPGNATAVTTPEGEYSFEVVSVDPNWELRTEGLEGTRAFAVTVSVRSPAQQFMRQLLAGYPQHTEDVIPGKGRVVKLPEFGGRAIIDEALRLSLEAAPQRHFWLKDSAAVYLRAEGGAEWAQRPIEGLPRYNDYVSNVTDVWPTVRLESDPPFRPALLDVDVPAVRSGEAFADVSTRVTGFLRYAVMQEGFVSGGAGINPYVEVELAAPGGATATQRLLALDPMRRSAYQGQLTFDWVKSEDELAAFASTAARELILRVPGSSFERTVSFRPADLSGEGPLEPLGDTGFSFRIRSAQDRLPLADGRTVTLLLVDWSDPAGKRFTRWVFEDPARNRDNPEAASVEDPVKPIPPDERVEMVYRPGRPSGTIALVAGPAPIGLRMFYDDGAGGRVQRAVAPGDSVDAVPGMKVSVRRYIPDAQRQVKPRIVPRHQRDRDSDAMQSFALVRVEFSSGSWSETRWIPMHRYSFDTGFDGANILSRFEPELVRLPDGRVLETIVGRERRELPVAVVLDDFHLTTHVGGFTGRVSSIRDWNSVLKFQTEGGGLSAPVEISTNDPAHYAGLWYFQAFWDAPRPAREPGDIASAGLAFTGLGIGNRNGVYTQLIGCCISVAGMVYAFYIKPIIRRRRRLAVLADIEAGRLPRRRYTPLEDTPIMDDGGPPAIVEREDRAGAGRSSAERAAGENRS
ncbi:MAG: hypothetical protein SFZ24_02770 [Planctomycetota bacterium]|nr:hypothetical protein [Planctomycetota bacterium]